MVAILACTAGWLGLAASPAGAHTTGPQLVSHFDRLSPAAPGVSYQLLSTGSAPYATVSVSGPHTFEIHGFLGEPFIRITRDGVQINNNSPSVTYMVTSPSKPLHLPATVNTTPDWHHVSDQPLFHYYERRAEWPYTGQPQEARTLGGSTTVYRFSISAAYDGAPTVILGHVTWIPAPFNLEVPLLFVPIVVVILLWAEPKAKAHLRPIAVATAVVAVAGAAVDAGRTVVSVQGLRTLGAGGLGHLAPLAVVPGLVLVVALAVPRLLAGQRAAFAWVAAFGIYLVAFGLVRLTIVTPAPSALATWLHRAELAAGVLTAGGAGMLLFLTSPVRRAGRSPRRPGRAGGGHTGSVATREGRPE